MRKLHTCQTPWSACLETLLSNWHSCQTPQSVFSNSWDWWPGRGNTKFEESFSTRRDGHSAELAGVTTKSDGKWRTIGYEPGMMFNWRTLWLHHTATENHADCDHARHRPATEDSDSHKKAQPIREPLQFRLRG